MRIALLSLAFVATALTATIEPADAQPRPWCFRGGEHSPGGGLLVCSYQTLEQCMGTVNGGNEGCVRNPDLAWDRIEGRRPQQQPRRQRERY